MRKNIISILLLAFIIISFVSCANLFWNEGKKLKGTENAQVTSITETNWLSTLGNIDGLDVKSYQLRGEGPDGASFDWIDVKGTKVALSDIRRGQWTLYARAIGENGEILATGSLQTFLSDSSPMGALYLDSEAGYGDARCTFEWNTFQVLYPEVEVYLKKGDGQYVPRGVSEIFIKDGVATWEAREIEAGSYVVRAILKDEGEVVAGAAAAMRVINGKISVGNVRFIVGKLSTIYGISLTNSPAATIRGELKLEGPVVTYVTDSKDLRHDWFLNGEYVGGYVEDSLNLSTRSLPKGFYRIDCIVQNSSATSINSDSILVYVDGAVIRQVTEEEADGAKDSVPTGYFEIITNSVH